MKVAQLMLRCLLALPSDSECATLLMTAICLIFNVPVTHFRTLVPARVHVGLIAPHPIVVPAWPKLVVSPDYLGAWYDVKDTAYRE